MLQCNQAANVSSRNVSFRVTTMFARGLVLNNLKGWCPCCFSGHAPDFYAQKEYGRARRLSVAVLVGVFNGRILSRRAAVMSSLHTSALK